MSVFQRIATVIVYGLLIYFEAGLIMGMTFLLLFLAIIIRPLMKAIRKFDNMMANLIASQYDKILEALSYDGESKVWLYVSNASRTLLCVFCISFCFSVCLYMAIVGVFYGVFIPPLRKPSLSSVSTLYIAQGHLGNKLNRVWKFDETTNGAQKAICIIVQLFNHAVCALFLFSEAIVIPMLVLVVIWMKWIRTAVKNAMKRTMQRSWRHLKAFIVLCTGKQPDDIEIEVDDDEDGFINRHYKKDGTLDMRYRENKDCE